MADEEVVISKKCGLNVGPDRVILEDFSFTPNQQDSGDVTRLAEIIGRYAIPQGEVFDYVRRELETRLIVVSDTRFKDFVKMSTEVVTRIRIDPDTGTVQSSALWTEELLPADTLLYGLALAKDSFAGGRERIPAGDIMAYLAEILKVTEGGLLQLGGDETVGPGPDAGDHGLGQRTDQGGRMMNHPNEDSLHRTLDQARARAAWQLASETRETLGKNKFSDYRSLAKKFPAMINNNGLGQSLAFLFAKKKNNRDPHGALLEHLGQWLTRSRYNRDFPPPYSSEYQAGGVELMKCVMENNSASYIHATREALAFLDYLRSFADGLVDETASAGKEKS